MIENNDNSNAEQNTNKEKKPLIYGILLMVVSSVCVCFGQMFWKLGGKDDFLFLAMGFALYIIGAISMIFAYRFGKLSQLQPILSLNYPISVIIAWLVFEESLNLAKIIALILIAAGIVFIAREKKDKNTKKD